MPKANHDLASLEVLDKESLKKASAALKKNGETEVASLIDSAKTFRQMEFDLVMDVLFEEDFILLINNKKVYKSVDKGTTWNESHLGLPATDYHSYLYSLNDSIYWSYYSEAYVTTNKGESWKCVP